MFVLLQHSSLGTVMSAEEINSEQYEPIKDMLVFQNKLRLECIFAAAAAAAA